ncbi:CLUMA_CG008513, isoform A [Clunio marinus]|uniref:CLUMA_CG008513, isoform A n=1 Tax=Clunio marinus TaxID=568069 RepID=A0A1J1I4A7_9DIPT|nr:CLUMA_CG008513, isoform A [Clunio marinus]
MWKIVSSLVILGVFFYATQAQDSCLQCTSSAVHPECISPDGGNFLSACPAGQSRNQSCYTRIDDGGNVERGCLGRLPNETINACETETCQVCIGPGCNGETFPTGRLSCIVCSGGENSTCAGNVTMSGTVCPIYADDDQCYVARPNGNWERGCLSSLTTRCLTNGTCSLCSGQGCNFGDFNGAVNIHSSIQIFAFALLSIIVTMLNK